MSKNLLTILTITSLLILSGCGSASDSNSDSNSSNTATTFYTGDDFDSIEPCDLLTESIVKSESSSASSASLTQMSVFGCTYDWDDNRVEITYSSSYLPESQEVLDNSYRSMTGLLTAEEEQKANQALQDQIDESEDINSSDEPTVNSILDAAQNFADQQNFQAISGIGDRAAWDDFSKSMVVQHNNFIFTLKVDQGADNQQVAQRLAPQIIENLDSQI